MPIMLDHFVYALLSLCTRKFLANTKPDSTGKLWKNEPCMIVMKELLSF